MSLLHEAIEADRITRLAEAIRAADKFRQDRWWELADSDDDDEPLAVTEIYFDGDTGEACGSACCVIGHGLVQGIDDGVIDLPDIKLPSGQYIRNFEFVTAGHGGAFFSGGGKVARYLGILDERTFEHIADSDPCYCWADTDEVMHPTNEEAASMLCFYRDTAVLNPWVTNPLTFEDAVTPETCQAVR